jgi:hypothetical protein
MGERDQQIIVIVNNSVIRVRKTVDELIMENIPILKLNCSQGCQMVYFQPKNFTLGEFWRVLPFGIFDALAPLA